MLQRWTCICHSTINIHLIMDDFGVYLSSDILANVSHFVLCQRSQTRPTYVTSASTRHQSTSMTAIFVNFLPTARTGVHLYDGFLVYTPLLRKVKSVFFNLHRIKQISMMHLVDLCITCTYQYMNLINFCHHSKKFTHKCQMTCLKENHYS